MLYLYIFLGWMFIYWLPNLALLIYIVRKDQDIDLEDLIIMSGLTALFGPAIPFKAWLEYADARGTLNQIVFKKCTKREVWQALGGKE